MKHFKSEHGLPRGCAYGHTIVALQTHLLERSPVRACHALNRWTGGQSRLAGWA
ncbi:hypothetical protein Sinac_2471 [Singulisphaera acidiphila DSM 18658]|uniref:Uncharacterized protein n=1 Tax=Singulisphaera acidiphila (strain ATCC BAA-1392 / DSM 18658 / VKM B-2454 / MOB10) TaxID=886293 RepID=L0DD41_SINAD|nr:hypothetical protein Sinac_2471 [Singulisphaera acidiphila DSM 18658]